MAPRELLPLRTSRGRQEQRTPAGLLTASVADAGFDSINLPSTRTSCCPGRITFPIPTDLPSTVTRPCLTSSSQERRERRHQGLRVAQVGGESRLEILRAEALRDRVAQAPSPALRGVRGVEDVRFVAPEGREPGVDEAFVLAAGSLRRTHRVGLFA